MHWEGCDFSAVKVAAHSMLVNIYCALHPDEICPFQSLMMVLVLDLLKLSQAARWAFKLRLHALRAHQRWQPYLPLQQIKQETAAATVLDMHGHHWIR